MERVEGSTNLQSPKHKLATLLVAIRRVHTNRLCLAQLLEQLVCRRLSDLIGACHPLASHSSSIQYPITSRQHRQLVGAIFYEPIPTHT